MATNGSSTKRPTRFRWNLGCRLHDLAPGIMLLRFVELCLAGTTKIFEASKLTFGCHWTAMCVQCIFIHFLSFFNSTSLQKNKFHNFTTSARDDHPWESKLLLFWHRHFAELVPGHLASHLFPKTTSGPAQKIKKKSLAAPFSEVKIVCSNHQSQRHLSFQSPHVLSNLNRRTGSSVARDGLIPHLPVQLSAKARQNSREAAF